MEKTKKAYEIVIDSIKEQIMNQELVLGQGLPPEREISEKIGVSRNSVREALKILTVMGVVSSRQGAGNYISGNFKGYMVDALSMMFMLDKLDYDQINQIRIGLEMQAYALAVKNAETKDIIELQEYVKCAVSGFFSRGVSARRREGIFHGNNQAPHCQLHRDV